MLLTWSGGRGRVFARRGFAGRATSARRWHAGHRSKWEADWSRPRRPNLADRLASAPIKTSVT